MVQQLGHLRIHDGTGASFADSSNSQFRDQTEGSFCCFQTGLPKIPMIKTASHRSTLLSARQSSDVSDVTRGSAQPNDTPWFGQLTSSDRHQLVADDSFALGSISLLLTFCAGIGLMLAVFAVVYLTIGGS
jgi:hypothetical protein